MSGQDNTRRKLNGRLMAGILAVLSLTVSLSIIFGPLVRDRIARAFESGTVRSEIESLQERQKEHENFVTRQELKLVLDQIRGDKQEIIRRLERIEDKLSR